MLRLCRAISLIALTAAIPSLSTAATFEVGSTISNVTIYPGQATITRQVTLDVPEGRHDIILPGLPATLNAQGLRVSAPTDVQIGAVNLARGRLPVTQDQTSPAIEAAKAEVERLEDILRQRNVAIAEIRLRVETANEQIAFLQGLSQASAGETLTAGTVADIQALAQMVGRETLTLRQAAFAAEEQAKAAERDRKDDAEALKNAQQALGALMAPGQDQSVLTFTLAAATAGEVTVNISTVEGYANWQPVYDMRLTTGDNPSLDIERSVIVSQQTGQDWLGVNLTLSTARPGERIAASPVFATPRRIISEDELAKGRVEMMLESDTLARSVAGAPMAMQSDMAPTANFSGATVTYNYPGTVDIRNGVDDLRLPLDTLAFDADIWAEAAPSRDQIAYRMAEFTNTTQEILLPGRALMFTDGTMVGFADLGLLTAGAETQMGFGPLDGLQLTRVIPNRTEGDAGILSRSNQLAEAAVITVENLTGQQWKVLLRDTIPYSEQEDLEVAFTATPRATRVDPEGQRGILEWDLTLPAGVKQELRLDYTLTWPNGYVLQPYPIFR